MVKENNNGNNGKEEIRVSLGKELNQRVESYAEDQEKSVQTVAREALEHYVDRCDTKQVIRDACEKGDLRAESKACKYVEESEREN
jgi:predicted transcriptional regulator